MSESTITNTEIPNPSVKSDETQLIDKVDSPWDVSSYAPWIILIVGVVFLGFTLWRLGIYMKKKRKEIGNVEDLK